MCTDQTGVPPKNIVLFSDGTGNSSAKLFKTNVWRLYQAVDVAGPAATDPIQLVKYDDGVGTSTFKPLALLGGAFGVGLKRNVLELYQFVCRTYSPNDRIYAFGFSRGAFTIRVLIGLITTVGIIDAGTMSQSDLDDLSGDAYRKFRRHFRLAGDRRLPGLTHGRVNRTDLFVTPLRNLRDAWIARGRRKRNGKMLSEDLPIPDITFVGVWDTVAAYGSPIAEVTKGIDRWVWPLSMPNYALSDRVNCARHALALDDERDTFHPLLWDEVHESELVRDEKVSESRMRQVWFAGMHSDVGGGYPDESLAYVSLAWIAREAVNAGLRLRAGALEEFETRANPLGPMHDSRAGIGAYYRYQPRKIAARLATPDPSTRILQDPDFNGRGLLTEVRIHESVLRRIESGTEGYAPIVLPADYRIEGGQPREQQPALRAEAQEQVWDRVWRRRVHYFVTLGLTLGLAGFPLLPQTSTACVGPQCAISPWIERVGSLLPGFAATWIDAWAARPGTFLLLVIAIVLMMRTTTRLEREMRDLMSTLFRLSRDGSAEAIAELRAAASHTGWIRRLRRSSPYQVGLQALKWRAAPGLAAVGIYVGVAALLFIVASSLADWSQRAYVAWRADTDAVCVAESSPGGGERSTDQALAAPDSC